MIGDDDDVDDYDNDDSLFRFVVVYGGPTRSSRSFGEFDFLVSRKCPSKTPSPVLHPPFVCSFVRKLTSTNSFLGGAISGGGFEYGISAQGPGSCNDNKFYGTCIEPPDTDVSHVYVTGSKTNVRLHDVRLEATAKSLDRPIVIIDDSSYGNVMDGILGHTHVMANLHRNPGMDLSSLKSVGLDPAPSNVYWNAAFKGYGGPGTVLPGWALVGGSNVTLTMMADAEMLYPDHHVISIDCPGNAGG